MGESYRTIYYRYLIPIIDSLC